MDNLNKSKRKIRIFNVEGLVSYYLMWEFQKTVVQKKIDHVLKEDILILLEHKPVFTIDKKWKHN